MQRVTIIGCSGGGKSTLARAVGARLGLPVIHLDALFWKPGWTESDPVEFRASVEAAAAGERWVIDGNFVSFGRTFFERADTIIWIEQQMLVCLWRAIWRALTGFGRSRSDLAPGCPEKIDLVFYRYIWSWNRATRPRMQAAIDAFAPQTPLFRLSNDAQVRAFVAGLATD